jgi:hypothetical protein
MLEAVAVRWPSKCRVLDGYASIRSSGLHNVAIVVRSWIGTYCVHVKMHKVAIAVVHTACI